MKSDWNLVFQNEEFFGKYMNAHGVPKEEITRVLLECERVLSNSIDSPTPSTMAKVYEEMARQAIEAHNSIRNSRSDTMREQWMAQQYAMQQMSQARQDALNAAIGNSIGRINNPAWSNVQLSNLGPQPQYRTGVAGVGDSGASNHMMKPSQVAAALQHCIDIRQPVIVWGPVGVGKSSVARQTATALNRTHIDIRASLLDPVDLRGIPTVVNGRTEWCPPVFLPRPDDPPSIVLLDELNRAPTMTMNALLQLVLDRKLGEYELPDNCSIISCCNREGDGGGIQKMPQALANRFVHIEMTHDVDDWCNWAADAGIEPVVIAFIRFRPELLYKYDAKERTFPTPRSWSFVSSMTARAPMNGIAYNLYAGAVGPGAATEYASFQQIFREAPNVDAILLNPDKEAIPQQPATLWAVASALAHRASQDNIGRVLTYVNRMPQEYGIYAIRDALARNQKLAATTEFTKWAAKHPDAFN